MTGVITLAVMAALASLADASVTPQSPHLDTVIQPWGIICPPTVPGIRVEFPIAGLSVGFETDFVMDLKLEPLPDSRVPAMTAKEYLDRATAADPRYEWREIGGAPVVRPKAAWNDPHNILNQRFNSPLHLTDVTLGEALKVLCEGRCLTGFTARADREPFRFSAHFDGGTFLEAIAAVMRAHGPVVWHYWHRTIATNVVVFGKHMPDQVVPCEYLVAAPVEVRR